MFDGIQFVWVPPGEFLMGSAIPPDFLGLEPTRVRISRGFWLGQYEVTQSEWQAVMGTNPSYFSGCGRCPVEQVSWEDAQAFIRSLNGRAAGKRYRLPTTAEWEYAARAGRVGDRHRDADVDAIAWHAGNSEGRPQSAGRKEPNAWGLHDMLGNVMEWVQDWHWRYPGASLTDPTGPGSGSYRVNRGGSWYNIDELCRTWIPGSMVPDSRHYHLGFRLLRSAEAPR